MEEAADKERAGFVEFNATKFKREREEFLNYCIERYSREETFR
jgi:hypothetical protein